MLFPSTKKSKRAHGSCGSIFLCRTALENAQIANDFANPVLMTRQKCSHYGDNSPIAASSWPACGDWVGSQLSPILIRKMTVRYRPRGSRPLRPKAADQMPQKRPVSFAPRFRTSSGTRPLSQSGRAFSRFSSHRCGSARASPRRPRARRRSGGTSAARHGSRAGRDRSVRRLPYRPRPRPRSTGL